MIERKVYLYSVDIVVSSGKGGNGCISFRREALIPKGGPDGGDGGRGGSVYIMASKKLETTADFKFRRNFKAQNGCDGSSNNKTGASGDDLTIKVPLGTQIWIKEKLLFDLIDEYPRLLAKGGRGGLGNQHFATPDLQTPYIATDGEPSTELTISLVLKHLADVGVIGMPNAGKSTLVYKLSRAPVKIGDYAFSTIEPVLGIIKKQKNKSTKNEQLGNIEEDKIQFSLYRRKLTEEIAKLELSFLKSQTKKSYIELDRLLADDFIEIELSGKLYDKNTILEKLSQKNSRSLKKISQFTIMPLRDHLFLAMYNLEEDQSTSMRSSLWRKESGQYQLVMHRGIEHNPNVVNSKSHKIGLRKLTICIDKIISIEDQNDQHNRGGKSDCEVIDQNSSINQSDLNTSENLDKLQTDVQRLVIADLPGLMEGSHRNIGLGHRFLQHLYRCKMLLHVVDSSDQKAFANFNTILEEVRLYDPQLLEKPQLVCISKTDISLPEQVLELELRIRALGYETLILSEKCEELLEVFFDTD